MMKQSTPHLKPRKSRPEVSIVVPLLNEEESLPELYAWIKRVLQTHGLSYEIVFIDDGSTDNSWDIIQGFGQQNDAVKGIRFRRNYGKSAALNEGFKAAAGEVVITMDADLQDSPDEIPELRRMIIEDGWDLVSGWKKKRKDPVGKTIPSKLFNYTTRKMSGIPIHDFNCGLKAYRLELVKNIEVYGEMHRYIPLIAKWAGFKKISEKVVKHQERKFGVTKFGADRLVKGYLDLLTITFVSKFGKRPMHFFGGLGSFIFLIGFVIAGFLAYEKLFHDVYRMAERPLFFFGLLAMIIGVMLFLSGFLAEMISRNNPERNSYGVQEQLNL